MQVNPYLFYNGNCEAAFKFYAKVLGGEIEAMMTHEEAPESMPVPTGSRSTARAAATRASTPRRR